MKKLKRWWKKLCVGLAAQAKERDITHGKIKAVAATALLAATAATANAQFYSTYNYGGNYYSSRDTTFQNQNTGGYTGAPPAPRSDNWFIRGLIYTLGGLGFQAEGKDPYAPAPIGGGGKVPQQRN